MAKASIEIVSQSTVVDLQPASRHRARRKGAPDIASIETTLVVDEGSTGPQAFVVPGTEDSDASLRLLGRKRPLRPRGVRREDEGFGELRDRLRDSRRGSGLDENAGIPLDHLDRFDVFEAKISKTARMVRLLAQRPIQPEEDGGFRFSLVAPMEFTRLVKGGDLSVVVLLPPRAERRGRTRGFEVRLEDYTREPQPRVFGEEGETAGGRKILSWQWTADPELIIRYIYL